MRGTAMEGNPVNPAHVNDKTIPKNHADAGLDPILKDHVNKGTVLILGNHVDEVTLVPKNHVNEETVHVRMGMLTEVWTLLRSNDPTTLLWMP